jgi:hypothetical protein|tara:strand:+ start:397 stop:687 length:291 start_codon:yes stop_codon:yes gene_type:complete
LVYEYKDFVYIHDYGKARLYKANHLLFKGNAWSGILMFLSHTDNAPEVRKMFKAQLEQREKPKEKKLKAKNEINEMPPKVEKPKPTPTKKKKSIWE